MDELAEAFLSDAVEVVYPLAWVQPEWLGIELEDPVGGRAYRVDADTPGRALRDVRPPLRRWAARRALAACPARLDELLAGAERLEPHGRAAAVLGLLDASAALGTDERRQLLRVGLATGQARVRRAALELLTELDGPDAARCAVHGQTLTLRVRRGGPGPGREPAPSACSEANTEDTRTAHLPRGGNALLPHRWRI